MFQNSLRVRELNVSFRTSRQKVTNIINNMDFSLRYGEKTALVGESGCGKSLLAMALFGLLPQNAFVSGKAIYKNDIDLLSMTEKQINRLRGDNLVLIPQNPTSHLNPTLKIGHQIKESLRKKQRLKGKLAHQRCLDLLIKTGFEYPEKISRMYPHQLSGGMAQRVLLAIGLSGNPDIVVADEPTRGLDRESQSRYLDLVNHLYNECALLIITHQLEVARKCDRLMIMYGGEIIEEGSAIQILNHPQHPYTKGLMLSHPDKGMVPIPGLPFSFSKTPKGCRFSSRCLLKEKKCSNHHPSLRINHESGVRCHNVDC